MSNPLQNPVNQPGQFPQSFQPQYVQAPMPMQQPQAQPVAPPAGAPQQPQQPPQQQQPSGANLDARIPQGSQDWPRELWGRTLRDALRIYNGLAEDFRKRYTQQQPLQPQPQPQPQQLPQNPQPQQFNQQPPQPPQPQEWEQRINAAVQNALQPYAANAGEMVRNRVAMQFPDWQLYDSQVLEILRGADPALLMNEDTWRTAYYLAKGRAVSAQQVNPYQPQYQSPYGQPQQPPTNAYGAIVTPPPPAPGLDRGYFSEAPTTPAPGGGPQDLTNNPDVAMMAHKWNLPPQELAQWWGGNVPPAQRGQF